MANQAFSKSDDLLVGSGTLYFKRNYTKDKHGFHNLGSSTGFSISTEIEKIDKNSSMSRHRELMASVVTKVKPTAKITLEEYNPYNLALGLFGEEALHKQAAKTLTNVQYEVLGNPSIINLVDADGNRYFNVENIVLSPGAAIPAKFEAVSTTASMSIKTGTLANDTLEDAKGGKIKLVVGSFSQPNNLRVFITVKTAPTAQGSLAGMELEVKEGASGAPQSFSGSAGTTKTFTLTCGAKLEVTVGGTHTFTADASMNEALLTPAVSAYKKGKDYTVSEADSRAGIVRITEDSAIKAGMKVNVSGQVPEQDFICVNGATAGMIEGELLFVGDASNGPNYVIEGWKCRITPDGEMSGFISENEFGSYSITVDFLSDYENHSDCPFYKATRVGSAAGMENKAGYYDPKY